MTKVINFYGGPGSGKSTSATGLFYLMKSNNLKVELVTEYAKELIYEDRLDDSIDTQLEINKVQNNRLKRLYGKVDYIVTDAPILMTVYYSQLSGIHNVDELLNTYNMFDNIDIYVKRIKKFQTYGRKQSEDEAKIMDHEILTLLKNHDIEYLTYDGTPYTPYVIYDTIISI